MTPDLRKFLTASQRRAYDKAQAKGEVKGRTETKAEVVLKILAKRGLPITPRQRRQITECTDLATLDRWFDRALTAASVDELLSQARRVGR